MLRRNLLILTGIAAATTLLAACSDSDEHAVAPTKNIVELAQATPDLSILVEAVVAAGLATKCLVQVSYAIGVAQPTSIMVDTFGTGKISDEKIVELIRANFDLRPKGIVQMLDLLSPRYLKSAAYGHFGREDDLFTWEKTDKAEILRSFL